MQTEKVVRMARLIIVLNGGNKTHWQMPSSRAVINTDPYKLIYLLRDEVETLESNVVTGASLESDECQFRSLWLKFLSFPQTLPS